MNNIVTKLKSYGLKATPQRVMILNSIDNKGHANIDEIYEDVKKSNPTISLATIYKNITSLLGVNLLKEVSLNNFKSKYEITKEEHSHFICKKCGYIEDITLENSIKDYCKNLTLKEKFKLEDIELNIYGICKNCLK